VKVRLAMAKRTPSVVYWLGDNLYLNITNRCTNDCYFCIRKYKDGVNGFNLKLTEESSTDKIVKELREVINKRQWKEIVFCGFGEPLTRLDAVIEVTKQIKKNFGKSIRIDTNGHAYLIYKGRKVVEELKEAGVDRVSVSLNAHDAQTYNFVCKPKFENAFNGVLEFIERARQEFDTEITTVTIPEANIQKIEELARKLRVKFRLRAYEPCFW